MYNRRRSRSPQLRGPPSDHDDIHRRYRSRSPLLRKPPNRDPINDRNIDGYGKHHTTQNSTHRYNEPSTSRHQHSSFENGYGRNNQTSSRTYDNSLESSSRPAKPALHGHVKDSSDILWGGNKAASDSFITTPSTYNYQGCSITQSTRDSHTSNMNDQFSVAPESSYESRPVSPLPPPRSQWSPNLMSSDQSKCRFKHDSTDDVAEMTFEYHHQPQSKGANEVIPVQNVHRIRGSDSGYHEREKPRADQINRDEMERRRDEVILFKDTDAYKQFDKRFPKHMQNMTKERPVTPDRHRVPDGEWTTIFKLWQTDVYKHTKKVKQGIENNEDILIRRQKNIDYMKTQQDYDNYISRLPRSGRQPRDPRTPDKYKKMSRRAWDGQIKSWKLGIHDRVLELEAESSS